MRTKARHETDYLPSSRSSQITLLYSTQLLNLLNKRTWMVTNKLSVSSVPRQMSNVWEGDWTLRNKRYWNTIDRAVCIVEMMKGEWLLLASISYGSIKPSPIIDARGRSANWKEPKKRETSEAAHAADKNKHKEETQIDIVTSTFSNPHPSFILASHSIPPSPPPSPTTNNSIYQSIARTWL